MYFTFVHNIAASCSGVFASAIVIGGFRLTHTPTAEFLGATSHARQKAKADSGAGASMSQV
jgi:hypothetical protein